ncbi:MAG: hypothetical protein JO180_05425 [Gemmatirosa sp.]|nr:hypothetical protein [Gemmatirosa sp.]
MARATRTGSVVDNSLLVFCLIASVIALFLPAKSRDKSAATLRRTISAPLALLQRRAELSRAAFLSYDDRMQRMGDLASLRSDNTGLQSENARLRELLGLGRRLQWGFVAGEASPAQLDVDVVQHQILQTFNVTVGARAGVQPFAPVVSEGGLVGMIETVDAASSIAISYSHPDFRVSVTTPNDSAFGIVQAHLVSSGAERGLLEMRGVPFRSPLKAGQLIVSSGLGGTYPRGIRVGTVIREIVTAEKWARTYLLQPSAPLANIGPVFVLLKKRADAGVETVWMSPQAADSAARGVAAAGDSLARRDSLAREAALQESAARRAALDSARDSTATDSVRPRPSVPSPTAPAGAPVRVPVVTGGSAGAPAPRPAPQPRDTARAPVARPTVPRPTVPRPTVPVPNGTGDAGRAGRAALP